VHSAKSFRHALRELRESDGLQWGRRVHSAKRWGLGNPAWLIVELQWGRRVHSAKSAPADGWIATVSPGLQWGRRVHSAKRWEGRPHTNGRRPGFNGVAEFTRRRAFVEKEPAPELALQWGRRVHSAKSPHRGRPGEGPEEASMGS